MIFKQFPHGTIYNGDALRVLRTLPDASVHCCVTSPPYWGLRDYGADGQIGLEDTPEEYVARLVAVFDEVRRVLRDDGTLWLNLGDSYSSTFGKRKPWDAAGTKQQGNPASMAVPGRSAAGLAPKNLVGIPWRVAFALQARGWYLRCDVIWHKPNPMPESVQDRPTRAHEYLFLFSKSEHYYYDHEAVKEPVACMTNPASRAPHQNALSFAREVSEPSRPGQSRSQHRPGRISRSGNKERKPGSARGCPDKSGSNVCGSVPWEGVKRNRRSVWSIPLQPFPGGHFATFPQALVEPCILAGCPMGGTVIDPFFGSGTVGLMSRMLLRQWVGIELNQEYCGMAARRVEGLPVATFELHEESPLLRMMNAGSI